MHSRPVNAIFYHAKDKFIVIYQNGTLWQLPRMKVDMESWRRKEPYQGDSAELFLYRHQNIADDELAHLLPTHDFPDNLTNNSLTLFESWWLNHSYEWLKDQENNGNNQGGETSNKATQTKRKPVANAQAKKAPQTKKTPEKATAIKKTATKKQAVKKEAVQAKKQTNKQAQKQQAQKQQAQKTPQAKQKTTDESIKPSNNQQKTANKKPSTPTATTHSEDIFEELLNHWDDL